MTFVETRVNLWQALAGRAPGNPGGPADPGLWSAVVERLNPARARPVLRDGIEWAELVSARGAGYVMLRSPDDGGRTCYLRLSPQEWRLAKLMDGGLTVARLVAEFARIARRLAPDQVRRVVADLAANRMLEELPVDAFGPLDRVQRRPWPARLGSGVLAVARGQRMVLANVDPLMSALYRAGGRLVFARPAAAVFALVAVLGLALFGWTWWRGDDSLFLAGGSYAVGAAVLLGCNVFALACHELGHALATKHARRRVPAAGLLVYFGIPSAFVDTTDVWMAGRRARILTTAAGPASALVLAGLVQLVALGVPAAGALAFKLAFVCYLNVLLNLSPFLPLDGYYLLMDWLEIPDLRARATAWLLARLRRRPPGWSALDGEGRLIALYGLLAVLWLVIAMGLGYRIWADRLSGLVTGLWHDGWPERLLLLAVVGGLAAPLVHVVGGWLLRRVRSANLRRAERRDAVDLPRRVAALRGSELGRLPDAALTALASRARWVRPSPGRHLVLADTALPAVYVVVDGALHGRRRGDPGGTIRHRAGPGSVVGLASALTGAPAALDWHTAGTTLLALPTAVVATVIGPLPGPPPAERAEADALFAETPALVGLSDEQRLALTATARPVMLEPGEPVVLTGPTEAIVVAAGVIMLPDAIELRRGTLIGPVGEGTPGAVATARTQVRLWAVADASNVPVLIGGAPPREEPADAEVRAAPVVGMHPVAGYPPLAAPPGPPPDGIDDVDRHFERRLWWLFVFLLVLAPLIAASSLRPGPAWAEMPGDRALLSVDSGRLTAVVDGRPVELTPGEQRYLGRGARVDVGDRSVGRLSFPGGAVAMLCADSRVDVGPLSSDGTGTRAPAGRLTLAEGRVLADTAGTSGAFRPLALTVDRPGGVVTNSGAAWYSVDATAVEVSTGNVQVAGAPVPPSGGSLACAGGVPVPPPAGTPTESAAPGDAPSGEPGAIPATPSTSATPTATPDAEVTPDAPRTPDRPAPPPAPPTRTPAAPQPTATVAAPTTPPPTTPAQTIGPDPEPTTAPATTPPAEPTPEATAPPGGSEPPTDPIGLPSS